MTSFKINFCSLSDEVHSSIEQCKFKSLDISVPFNKLCFKYQETLLNSGQHYIKYNVISNVSDVANKLLRLPIKHWKAIQYILREEVFDIIKTLSSSLDDDRKCLCYSCLDDDKHLQMLSF